MPKSRKPSPIPEPPSIPQVGDKLIPERSESTWVVSHVSSDGKEVNLNIEGTYLERFRVRSDTLRFVDKVPRTSKPEPKAKPRFNVGKVLERIATVQKENLQRLEDDIGILSKYLETEGAPKEVLEALETLSNEQQASWQAAVESIEELMEEQ